MAYYLHWSRSELLSLEHAERARWVESVGRINQQLSEGGER